MELHNSTGGIALVENGRFYKLNDEYGYECYVECSKSEFIEYLKGLSWVCLTSWDKNYRQDYLNLVDYVNAL